MVNVLHLINGEQYSGLERVIDHLANKAPDYGYRFHLVCLKPGQMIRFINTKKAYIYHMPMRSRFDLKVVRDIRRIALENNCSLIHSHTVRSAIVGRILKTMMPLPWLHQIHSPALYESEHKILNYVNYLIEKCILTKADKLLPVSNALRDYIHTQYRIPLSRIKTILNGVPVVSKFDKKNTNNSKVPTIGAVGLFRPRKGIETLLRACHLLLKHGVAFQLSLIGAFVTEVYRQDIKGLVTQLGLSLHVEYTGFKQDIIEYLGRLDVFVLPSLYGEGIPMVLLEAMAVRRVIVASSIDGVSDVLQGGQYGKLVTPGNSAALADTIEKAIVDYEINASMAVAAQKHQRSKYSINVMTHNLFEVYKHCISQNMRS